MVVYHFFWDLGYFQFIELEKVTQGLPLFFAQCVGASFIIISGISIRLLTLSDNFRETFFKRLIVLLLICLLISSVTFFINRNSFIFFGILHFLTTCSIISLLLVKVRTNTSLLVLFVFSVFLSLSNITYDFPLYLSWLGFNEKVPITNDFYPLFPWISFYLFGVFICQPFKNFLTNYYIDKTYIHDQSSLLSSSLKFLGRNSLAVYILHQPIFFSLFLIFIRISS